MGPAAHVSAPEVAGTRPGSGAELLQPFPLPATEWFAGKHALDECLDLFHAMQVKVAQEPPCVSHVRDAGGSHFHGKHVFT